MSFYTCPKCGSTYELREDMDYCPACREKIHSFTKGDVIDADYLKYDDGQRCVDPFRKSVTVSPQEQKQGIDDSVEGGEGSILAGLALGFFLNTIGLIVAAILKKKRTLIGALIGFGINMVAAVIILLVVRNVGNGAYLL